jgi:hypothetical protein
VDNPATKAKVHRLFDLRWVIAGLLSIYGVVLIIRGLLDGSTALAKAAGVRINLWTGIGLLAVGLLFALWAAVRPLQPPSAEEADAALQTGQIPDSDAGNAPSS